MKAWILILNECYVSNANDDSEIRPVANQLVHSTTDFGNQKAVFQGVTLDLCPMANFLKGLFVQSNDSAHVLI
jgi:hypothetical protein